MIICRTEYLQSGPKGETALDQKSSAPVPDMDFPDRNYVSAKLPVSSRSRHGEDGQVIFFFSLRFTIERQQSEDNERLLPLGPLPSRKGCRDLTDCTRDTHTHITLFFHQVVEGTFFNPNL